MAERSNAPYGALEEARSESDSAKMEWRIVNAATLSCAGLGYLIALINQPHLTLIGFSALTLSQIGWFISYTRFERSQVGWVAGDRARATVLWAAMLMICATASSWVSLLGTGYDWLLPVITVGALLALAPWRRVIIFIIVIYLGAIVPVVHTDLVVGTIIWNDLFTITSAFIFAIAFVVMARRQTEARRRTQVMMGELAQAHQHLSAAHAQLRISAAQAEDLAITHERNRMAREIHDTLGHYLTVLAVKLETATHLEEHHAPGLGVELADALQMARECLREVRTSVNALRPGSLEAATSFAEALHQLGALAATSDAVEVIMDIEGDLDAITLEQRGALYRATQEALTNIRKHAQASKILIRLRVDATAIELTVLDNGCGATASNPPPAGFGLLGMRERVAMLGGSVTAGPIRGHGWRVDVTLPLRQPALVEEEVH